MKVTRISSICGLILVAAFSSTLGAQDGGRAKEPAPNLVMTPAQRTFAQAYVAAIRSPDIERYMRLLHKRSRACITPTNADFFSTILERRVGRFAQNPRYSVKRVKGAAIVSAARNNGIRYPERPTHAIQIDMIPNSANNYAITAFVVRENGIWYEVLPCPLPKNLELMKEAKLRSAADSTAAKAMADSLQGPLRFEVLTLAQDSGSVTAAKRYAEAVQIDFALARRVVKALLEQGAH
ncbi:MAG TPA: hypothetical protein VNO75_01965 [Gemmatimonadaceae bacterium]|nr:hypothetical protein [Gemmatimonadaceae bacterium]